MERSFELRTVKLEFTRRKRIKRQQSGNEWSDNNQKANGATTIRKRIDRQQYSILMWPVPMVVAVFLSIT